MSMLMSISFIHIYGMSCMHGMVWYIDKMLTVGRCMLAAMKTNCWGFVVFGEGTEISVHGPEVMDAEVLSGGNMVIFMVKYCIQQY